MTDDVEHLAVPAISDPTRFGYTHGVRVGRWVAIAGQCAVGPDGRAVLSTAFEEQALAVLENMERVVIAAGGDRTNIVSTTVFVTDIRHGPAFADVRSEFFGGDFPTSTLVAVTALMPVGALVEAEGWAHLPPA